MYVVCEEIVKLVLLSKLNPDGKDEDGVGTGLEGDGTVELMDEVVSKVDGVGLVASFLARL